MNTLPKLWLTYLYEGNYELTSAFDLPVADRNGVTVNLLNLNDEGMPYSQISDLITYFYKEN